MASAQALHLRTRGTVVFSASQASDGMLRTMALITLLSQPEQDLPGVLVLDEPELGLHPYAMSAVCGLIRSASVHCLLIIATQSAAFVNQFTHEDIVVVERSRRESDFRRLDGAQLRDWLDEYSIAELWEKRLLRISRPSHGWSSSVGLRIMRHSWTLTDGGLEILNDESPSAAWKGDG